MDRPETRYATTVDGLHIAYQVLGDGPADLVFVPGFVFNVEQLWDWGVTASFARRLSEFTRLIVFDRRGTGLSDRIVQSGEQLTLEARMDDIRAVMDAAGSERATLIGFEEGGLTLTVMFASTYPERTAALVSLAGAARSRWAPDYPWAWTDGQWESFLDQTRHGWGTEAYARAEGAGVWPGLDDPAWVRDYAMWMRRSVSPGDAAELFRIDSETDVRELLATVRVPTLVVHRIGDRENDVEESRYLAGRIPGAMLVELPGESHGWMSPDQDEVLDEVERWVKTLREEEAELDRVLATVLFTDIVGSTGKAAELGDAAWRDLVERHHAAVRALLARYRGREVGTAGDGFFASFDGPARAVRCARAIADAVQPFGLEIRAGLHTGEVETIDGRVGGIAVAIGARIGSLAGPSEILVSQTVKDLVAGSRLTFEDRGEHELKGVPGEWRLYAVTG